MASPTYRILQLFKHKHWQQAFWLIANQRFVDIEDRKKLYAGDACYCNLCESHISEFFPYGIPQSENEICPICNSHKRHRLFKHWLDIKKNKLSNNPRILHFAPEKSVTPILKEIGKENYLSVDIAEGAAMKVEDMRSLSFDSKTFDLIFCSHVVQHIREDEKAFSELYRVLDDKGVLVLISSVCRGSTHETNYVSPQGTKIYKKMYQISELENILVKLGLDVDIVRGKDVVSTENDALRLGIAMEQTMFICTK
jgi:SAM-dependent methyltransferase